MALEIRMPELAADMIEADLVSWLVKPGDRLAAGDLIAEVETDKSTVELESPFSGTLLEILVSEGSNGVAVGTVLARLEEDAALEQSASPPRDVEQAPLQPPLPAPAPEATSSAALSQDASARVAATAISATALARRISEQSGLDLSQIEGSGQSGKIVKADVERALRIREDAGIGEAPTPSPAAPAPVETRAADDGQDAPFERIPHSRMRRTIAARLSEAKQTVPHFYLRVECDVERLLDVRVRLNAGLDGALGAKDTAISLNDFIVRAIALALVEVPDANVSWTDDALLRYQRVDVAVAVATDDGLVTPVVRDASRKQLQAISREVRDLAARARSGALRPEEYRGGTFTVSNLGMYGIESVHAILNPPQSCILGIGAASARPVVRNGEIVASRQMSCTLSADHRALDGAVGALLLAAFKRQIEDPLGMLL